MFVFLVISIIIVIFVIWIYCNSYHFRPNTINYIDGTNGCGKTQLCVYWSLKFKKKLVRKYKFQCFILKIFNKKKYLQFVKEKPYLYSNLKLKDTPFVQFTQDMLMRVNERPSLNSVGCLDEFSLVADQNVYGKDFKNIVDSNGEVHDLNECMRDFWKLVRHEGFKYVFVNSQNVASINYTLKDCISNYIWIQSRKWFPFYSVVYLREMAYSRDSATGVINNFDSNENNIKKILVPNRIFKKYDSRAYSIFTDSLPINDNEIIIKNRKDLKSDRLISFMSLKELYKNLKGGNK